MMKRMLVAALAIAASGAVAQEAGNDLRDIRVGMPVNAIGMHGYADLFCAEAPAHKLADWSAYGSCPAGATGERAIRFGFDDGASTLARVNDSAQGTKVAGHPVLLTLAVSASGVVDSLTIETDPHARPYLRKKAFLLGEQVKERYGEAGWHCTEGAPTAEQQPVGGVFVNEHCEKQMPARSLSLDRALFLPAGKAVAEAVDRTALVIRRSGG